MKTSVWSESLTLLIHKLSTSFERSVLDPTALSLRKSSRYRLDGWVEPGIGPDVSEKLYVGGLMSFASTVIFLFTLDISG